MLVSSVPIVVFGFLVVLGLVGGVGFIGGAWGCCCVVDGCCWFTCWLLLLVCCVPIECGFCFWVLPFKKFGMSGYNDRFLVRVLVVVVLVVVVLVVVLVTGVKQSQLLG